VIRDTLFCLTHPFQCIGDALGPWWWLIAIFAALIIVGLCIRVWHVAKGLGGLPAAIGAVGILGTIALALGTALTRRNEPPDDPVFTEKADAAPAPPRPKRKPGGPIFPNAPWNRR
jgi:hypothetical protein